jgi:hypothetical protein
MRSLVAVDIRRYALLGLGLDLLLDGTLGHYCFRL